MRVFDLVVAANRLPVARAVGPDGTRGWRPSPGGLVSAVEPVVRGRRAAWVGWAGEPGPAPEPFSEGPIHLRPVGLSACDVRDYYEGFSNATLWPLFHDVVVPAVFRRDWWEAYREVDERFARVIADVAARRATVWVHDYHLQLVPLMLRRLRPDLRVGWFDHVPFPPVELFAQLPWRRALLEGLLGADLLGFQRGPDAENFLRACRRLLHLDTTEDAVAVPDAGGALRTVRVRALPISVDFDGMAALARSPDAATSARAFRASAGDPEVLLLGLDRLDYTKGIRHRLRAYEGLLRDGIVSPPRVVLVQAGLPTRERIDRYRSLRAEVQATVARLNEEHSVQGCPAVRLLDRSFSRSEVVAMQLAADVLLVTPLRDGMNLVAKEYVACRHDLHGALVLSEFAGAWHELREAFSCNPHDVDGFRAAIVAAMTAPEAEQHERMAALRRRVSEHDVHRWAREFLEALSATTPGAEPA